MDVIPDFTKALFDSSEDSASAIPGPSTSLSYRPRRKPYKHVSMNFLFNYFSEEFACNK